MRDEILAYKRERILEEAVKLFYERGFTGTTLDDIAAELGVTKPFIYTHFRGKVELLAALCKPTIELSLDAVAKAAERPGTPTERLRHAITDFTWSSCAASPTSRFTSARRKKLSPEALDEINVLQQTVRSRFVGSADRGRALGRVRKSPTIPSPPSPSAA